uniref:Transmembrane protein 17B n=1 Tax=Elaeophora elaphi TaxID=1147741 RepID=A0A0R3S0L9_9BILA
MRATKRVDGRAEVEVLSSLPLQIALHYNVCLAPFWAIGLIVGLISKMHYLSITHVVVLSTLLFITIIIELIRLFLGYFGNLGEKISALSGFWVTSVILQAPIAAFWVLNSNIPLPLERSLCLYHGVFLLIEIIAGFLVIRKISHYQMARFKERVLGEEPKNRED